MGAEELLDDAEARGLFDEGTVTSNYKFGKPLTRKEGGQNCKDDKVVVRKGQEKATGRRVILKTLSVVRRDDHARKDDEEFWGQQDWDASTFIREIRAYRRLQKVLPGDTRFPQLIAAHLDKTSAGRRVAMVLPFYEGGNLKFLKPEKRTVPRSERFIAQCYQRAFSAVHDLHSKAGYLHSDIKLDNIFCSSRTDPASVVLADFGCVVKYDGSVNGEVDDVYGRTITAPEQVKDDITSTKTDVYCLGVSLRRALVGGMCYDPDLTREEQQQEEERVAGSRVAELSWYARDFLSRTTHRKPRERFNMVQAMEHPFLSDAGSMSADPLTVGCSDEVVRAARDAAAKNIIHKARVRFAPVVEVLSSIPDARAAADAVDLLTEEVEAKLHIESKEDEAVVPGAGMVSKDRLERIMQVALGDRAVALPLDALFEYFDKDDSGFINYRHFMCTMCSLGDQDPMGILNRCFNILDADDSGYLDLDEFLVLVRLLSAGRASKDRKGELSTLFHVADEDENERVSRAEFMRLCEVDPYFRDLMVGGMMRASEIVRSGKTVVVR